MRNLIIATALVAVAATGHAATTANPAEAQAVTKACAEAWKADKAAGKIKAGTTWPAYLSDCSKKPAAPAVEAKPAKAEKAAAKAEKKVEKAHAGTLTPGQQAAHERIRECGEQWRAAKAAGKIKAGQTWPEYWSACNKRMK